LLLPQINSNISLYGDDVVVFVRPNEQVLSAVKENFGIFGEALGVKVNYRKIIAT
jgi:GTP-dependent phosphoenolpyruvate carboxykinase